MIFDRLTHLQPLQLHHRTQSCSSIVSDTATFHSAQVQPQPPSLCSGLEKMGTVTTIELHRKEFPRNPNSPKINGIRMDRQDSGYSERTHEASQPSSRRNSQSSSRSLSRNPKPLGSSVSRSNTLGSTRSRPHARRSSRSTSITVPVRSSRSSRSSSLRRPDLPSRHTIPLPSQYFHFPILTEPLTYDPTATSRSPELATTETPTPPPPPPPTVHYWTSDSTRRLEYAAIDAASRGLRGFLVKLVPDCILPATARRPRFHCEDTDRSDAGSVRRYRLVLADDNDNLNGEGKAREGKVEKSGWKVRLGVKRD